MPNVIKDQATAENAARNLNKGVATSEKPGDPNVPKEKTTAEKLFPDFVTDDGGIVNRPIKQFEDRARPSPATVTLEQQVQPLTPPAPTPTVLAKLKPEEIAGKMVTVKVDGVESDVPAEQVLKSYQLERHLNAQLMKVAEERLSLEKEKAKLSENLLKAAPPEPRKQVSEPPKGQKSPEVQALESQIAMLQQSMDQLGAAVAPALRETGLKRLDAEIKEKYGADDFMQYAPKIQAYVDSELAKPEVMANMQARQILLSSNFWADQYKDMKIRDMLAKPSTPPNPKAPALVTQSGSPVILNNQGQPVSIPNIESSGGVASRSTQDGNWQGTYNALFERAQKSGKQDDWMAFYKHKTSGT